MLDEKCKLSIKLGENIYNQVIETVWAKKLSDHKASIDNVPFYAYGLSYKDIVEIIDQNGEFFVGKILDKSGHSTYRIFLLEEYLSDDFKKYWLPLEKNGCTYEKGKGTLISVDVPPTSDIDILFNYYLNNDFEREFGVK